MPRSNVLELAGRGTTVRDSKKSAEDLGFGILTQSSPQEGFERAPLQKKKARSQSPGTRAMIEETSSPSSAEWLQFHRGLPGVPSHVEGNLLARALGDISRQNAECQHVAARRPRESGRTARASTSRLARRIEMQDGEQEVKRARVQECCGAQDPGTQTTDSLSMEVASSGRTANEEARRR